MESGVFARAAGHEQIVFCRDEASGLRAIIAIYSTALGPALGGTRFMPYATETAALDDVLALSTGMAYKNALAGLDHGGGKAVIIGDPATLRSEALLRAYGRFVQGLGGRYITACDVGTFVQDMDVIALESDYVTGRSEANGGAGDSSVLTAYGVYQGMLAAAEYRWNDASLAGRRIGIAGIGKVGRHLVGHLLEEGAELVVTDPNPAAREWVREHASHAVIAEDASDLVGSELDVYAPCALGGALDHEVVEVLTAAIVCGAANNQLVDDTVDNRLRERGIVYCPDYLVNAGGVIQVSDERHGFSFERAKAKTASIRTATLDVLRTADAEGVTPSEAADRLAERRMASVTGVERIWTGRPSP